MKKLIVNRDLTIVNNQLTERLENTIVEPFSSGPIAPDIINKLISTGQQSKLEEIWKHKEGLIEYREDAAEVLSALNYFKGWDKVKKPYTEYMTSELVLDFPLKEPEQEVVNHAPISPEPITHPVTEEGKKRREAEITIREGQASFRQVLLDYYGPTCMVTKECLADVVEAAHIRPYDGQHTNTLGNGLVLRADVHKLFDKQLIGIDPDTLTIHIHSLLKNTTYEQYKGKRLFMTRPSKISAAEIQNRWQQFSDNKDA